MSRAPVLGRGAVAVVLAIASFSLLASPAGAQELYVAVEETAGADGSLPVVLQAAPGGRALVKAWRLTNPDALHDAGLRLEEGQTLDWLVPGAPDVPPERAALREAAGPVAMGDGWPVPLDAGARRTAEIPLGEPGLYLLQVEHAGLRAHATALVSDLGLVVKRSADGLLAWAARRADGEPVPDVEVVLHGPGGEPRRGRTDAAGLVAFPGPVPPAATVRATWGEHRAFGTTVWHPATAADRRVYLFTHQPAYRPGERVEVKGIVRAVQDGRYRLEGGLQSAEVRWIAPGDREMAKTTASVSADMGTFACGFDLPADAPTGDWLVVAELGGRAYQAPLVVAAYRRPTFEVSVRAEAPRVLAGGTAAFDVEASFYDGGALAGSAVRWEALYQRVDREVFPEDELVRLFFGTEREAYRPESLATGEGALDGHGRLRLRVEAPSDRPDGFLSLRVTVTGPDRMAVTGTGRVGLVTAPLVVGLKTDRHLYGPEDVARVTVRVEAADGGAAAGREGVLTVGLVTEVAGQAPRERWIHTLPFLTDETGTARLEAPLAGAGRYALAVSVPRRDEEPAGPPAHARLHVWAVGERATPGRPGAGLEVVADRDAYAVGERARLLVLRTGGGPVLATLEGDGLLEARVLRPGAESAVWEVPIGEAHVPNVFASFASIEEGRLLVATHVLRIPPRTRLLETTVLPDAAAIEPGSHSGLTVEVRDEAGLPVGGAEVSVAVVDEALFALHADPGAPLEAFFNPPRRNGVGTEDLLDWRSLGFALAPAAPEERLRARGLAGDAAGAEPMTAEPADAAGPPGAPPPPAMPAPARTPAAEEAPLFGAEELEEALHDEESGGLAFRGGGGAAQKQEGGVEEVRMREDFRSAVHWTPVLRTDGAGTARVDDLRYGDSLTRWRITARAVDARTRVGTATAEVRTRKNVSLRITLPRFLRAGDRALVPLLLRNLTEHALAARWSLGAAAAAAPWSVTGTAPLEAGGLHREEHEFLAGAPEDVAFEARVVTELGSDGERRLVPVLPQGIPKVEGRVLFADRSEARVEIRVPETAEPGTISCRVSVEPAYAQAMLAALPFLAGYPHGCTEQTMNRFGPVLAAAEALRALGQEPRGVAAELPAMVEAGVARLAALQHADGGFGWWPTDATDPGMTALAVRGLVRVVRLDPQNERAAAILERAAERLHVLVKEGIEDRVTRFSALLALAQTGRSASPALEEGWLERFGVTPRWLREGSPHYRALFLRAAVAAGRADLAAVLRAGLEEQALVDEAGVHWSAGAAQESGEGPTRWQDDDVETTATVLLALLEAGSEPEPLSKGARWLLAARVAGDRWKSTRDTAAAVEFLAAYTRATGDLGAGREVALSRDGAEVWRGALTPETVAAGAAVVDLSDPSLVPGGVIAIELSSPGGAASAGVAIRYHETGPAIEASDHGFRVARRFYLLEPREAEGRVTWKRTPVTETLPSGALVECEIEIETPREREYVMVTSPHVAGFEPWREVGMEVPGRAPAAEARAERYDDRTVFFLSRQPVGTLILRHTFRATHAGNYTALPAQAELMYFPDVRGNSDGEVWEVSPAGPAGTDSREVR